MSIATASVAEALDELEATLAHLLATLERANADEKGSGDA
ncbi:hypothetical protein RN51_00442 [Microbacterium oxydans]|uniref:Uncharacterized protein n=1 Tax=Microbacterium oxydans TaxID=82380 RepID=A0A0F0L0P0_9MICO|nr:hypothetical protein RN51_00442 [Microbacterium oxydans]